MEPKASFRDSNAWAEGTKMPKGLRHKTGETFSWETSEVARWIASNPIMLQHLFDRLRWSGAIAFDQETGTWGGSGA